MGMKSLQPGRPERKKKKIISKIQQRGIKKPRLQTNDMCTAKYLPVFGTFSSVLHLAYIPIPRFLVSLSILTRAMSKMAAAASPGRRR
jgi:hypothetical protein